MIRTFFRLLARCYRLARPYGRLKMFGVLALILLNGVLQLVGVSAVFPFFALAADPHRLKSSHLGGIFLKHLPPLTDNQLLVVAGVFAILMLVLSNAGSIVSEVLRIRYAFGFCHWLRGRLFQHYASRPYEFFLQRNSAELNLRLSDAQTFIQNVLLPVGEILTRLVLIILLVGAIFFVQPWVALGASIFFGGFYLLVFVALRPRLRSLSNGLQQHYVGFWKHTNHFLNGIKTVLVTGKSPYFMTRALEHSERIGVYSARIPIYSNGPRYLIEPLAFGSLMAIVIVLALRGGSFTQILPNLTVMAFAGYRLLPALQLLYAQFVSVAAGHYTLRQLEEEVLAINKSRPESSTTKSTVGLTLEKELSLEDVSFQYPSAAQPVLKNVSIKIARNESVGIAGASGSGKSTLVDLILGLHQPQSGCLRVDGKVLDQNLMDSWRSIIGYVAQDIYLLDDTIAANIAFGEKSEEINPEWLRQAALGAQILDFIEKELPNGMNTVVGERGVRLSGGQRQRIGLARALYHKPQILILDEATSALDNQTEKAVMETLYRLQGSLTMIIIAHRLSTLERCDRIIQLEAGSVK